MQLAIKSSSQGQCQVGTNINQAITLRCYIILGKNINRDASFPEIPGFPDFFQIFKDTVWPKNICFFQPKMFFSTTHLLFYINQAINILYLMFQITSPSKACDKVETFPYSKPIILQVSKNA